MVDVLLLVVGNVMEPYYLALDGHCALHVTIWREGGGEAGKREVF